MTDDTKVTVLENRKPHQRIEELTQKTHLLTFQIGLLTGAVNNLDQYAIKSVLKHLKDKREAINDDEPFVEPVDRLIAWASNHVEDPQADTPSGKPQLHLVQSTRTHATPAHEQPDNDDQGTE
jgi:hypothetical protein